MTTFTETEDTLLRLDVELRALRGAVDGALLTRHDAGYEEARGLWNGMLDKRPGGIVRAGTVADVQHAVRFAAAHDVPLAVRGGGHNVAGTASTDGGLVIDLRDLDDVTVDPGKRSVVAGGGARWAQVDGATQIHGLATPGGVVSDTGIGGLTLGGGIGWLRRKHGMSADNMIGVELVTADGQVRWVDAETDPELLWGLRGGGGNFGVATRFAFRLHPVGPQVPTAYVFYPAERSAELLRFFREYCADLADEVAPIAVLGTVPGADMFAREHWGRPYVAFLGAAITADRAVGERLLAPLRQLGAPIVDASDTMPYVEWQTVLDEDYPSGELHYYWKSTNIRELSDDVIALLAEHAQRAPSAHSTVDIWAQGGAMARVPADATAFGDRSDPFLIGVEANWEDSGDNDANIAWTREMVAALQPASSGKEYLNFPGFLEDGQRTLRTAFGDNYERLAALKRRLDPDNVFRLHLNIPPQ